MTDLDREFSPLPEEFPAPGAQISPPPPEFGGGGQGAPAAKTKKRMRRYLIALLTTGILSGTAVFGGQWAKVFASAPTAMPSPETVAAMTVTRAEDTPAPTAEPTPEPTATPSIEPVSELTPTPTPTPVPTAGQRKPRCQGAGSR